VKSAYTRPTRVADIPYVAEYMREEDVAEVQAFSGHTPQESLLHSFFQGEPLHDHDRQGRQAHGHVGRRATAI
jgi:hypothetical protein